MITQDSWVYKFIQFKLHKNVRFFIKIREIKRETCFVGIKCYLLSLKQIRNFFVQDHEIASKKRDKNSLKIE